MNDNAHERAQLSGKATDILNARTLGDSHQRLAELVTEGMKVLDIGCGTGAITKDIAEKVGPTGMVVGIDNNTDLINKARKQYAAIAHLEFHTGSIYEAMYDGVFDIVTCARVLQWLAEPQQAIQAMKTATKQDGKIVILDYNHEKIKWEPSPPKAMQYFYRQFLSWRADAGMDNAIVDKLPGIFKACGLSDIAITEQHEVANNKEDSAGLGIWAEVAASRGLQMVSDGYLTETERATAEMQMREWIDNEAVVQTMYLHAVEATKK